MNTLNRVGSMLYLAAVIVGYSACAILEPDDPTGRTYPEAQNLERVSLSVLRETALLPGSYNVRVYVVDINVCPVDMACYLPDGITVSETQAPAFPKEALFHLSVERPYQFLRRQRYIFSINAESAGWNHPDTGEEVRYLRVLGYSLVGYSQKTQ